MDRVREDAEVLRNPHFLSSEMEKTMREATDQVIESVKVIMEQLNSTHQQLMTMCQQKRDLFIVCVKFHMTTRQVSDTGR